MIFELKYKQNRQMPFVYDVEIRVHSNVLGSHGVATTVQVEPDACESDLEWAFESAKEQLLNFIREDKKARKAKVIAEQRMTGELIKALLQK